MLKKGLDKFSLLNLVYFRGENILPTNEHDLIRTFNKPIRELVNKLPDQYIELIKNKNDWNLDSEFISTTSKCNYYIEEDLNYLIFSNRKFKKAIEHVRNTEFELECQRFFDLMVSKTQEEYIEIRDFLEQRNHTYLTNSMLLENEEIMKFNKKYSDIIDLAYERIPYYDHGIKICPYCNLVLKEKEDGSLYCISKKCSRKTKGFLNVKNTRISGEVLALSHSVAYSIYYFGMLEQDIKLILNKNHIKYNLWPNFDTYDFEIYINKEKWALDAKDVKDYHYVIDDINEMSTEVNNYDRIFYVVPNDKDKGYYLDNINKNINHHKYKCITLKRLNEMIENGGVI